MALYWAIRRASISTIPLPLRSFATPTASYFSSADVNNGASRTFYIPVIHHFSTSTVKTMKKRKHSSFDDILIQIVDSEIKFALDSDLYDCVSSSNLLSIVFYYVLFYFFVCPSANSTGLVTFHKQKVPGKARTDGNHLVILSRLRFEHETS